MKNKKRDRMKRLTEITEKIDAEDVPMDKGIKLLGKASKDYKALKKDLFRKKGAVLIAKGDEKGEFNLEKFEEE